MSKIEVIQLLVLITLILSGLYFIIKAPGWAIAAIAFVWVAKLGESVIKIDDTKSG